MKRTNTNHTLKEHAVPFPRRWHQFSLKVVSEITLVSSIELLNTPLLSKYDFISLSHQIQANEIVLLKNMASDIRSISYYINICIYLKI